MLIITSIVHEYHYYVRSNIIVVSTTSYSILYLHNTITIMT